jgi:N utilization substance protein B
VTPPGPRRRAREAALQVLYAADLAQRLEPAAVDEVHGELIAEFELPRNARERARSLAVGVACNLKGIDEAISAASRRWKLYRMATVERNVLRIAAFELLFEPETPTEVIIDEAVEIARRFGGEAAPGFVNGLLDEVARAHRGARDVPREGAER